MNLLIREARPEDAEAIVGIFNPIIEAGGYTVFDTAFTVEAEREYIDLSHQRQGIAANLFVATFEAARRKGYEKIFTYVRSDNPAALAVYQRQGFRIVGIAQRQAKLNGKYVDEIMIEKFL